MRRLREYLLGMSMSSIQRICALGLWASLVSTGCDDDPERPYTSIDPSKADPSWLDGAPPRPSSSGENRAGSGPPGPLPALDAGLGERAPPPADAGSDAAPPIPLRGPGDFLSFDAAIALQSI